MEAILKIKHYSDSKNEDKMSSPNKKLKCLMANTSLNVEALAIT